MSVPKHLKINGRPENNKFTHTDLLYRGFDEEDVDELTDSIKLAHLTSPDYSCNWSRYSDPEDIRYREGGTKDDGCYSITVEDAKYKRVATPVHAPLEEEDYENYAHVDVRLLHPEDSDGYLPEQGRPKLTGKIQKKLRNVYRQYIVNNLKIEILPNC